MKRVKDVIRPEAGEIFDIELEEDFLEANRKIAQKNSGLLKKFNVKSIDIMGSVGAGKTALIELLVQRLKERYRIVAIGGDVTTTIDAERIARHGVDVIQINTGKECHLDANLVHKALKKIDLGKIDLLLVENVGNLICPADFPVGCSSRIVVISVTEGEHMVVKHPLIFSEADLVVINKKDLAEIISVNISNIKMDISELNPNLQVVTTSCKTGDGVDEVIKSLKLELM